MNDVFVSYASQDREIAERLTADLSAGGLNVFSDRDLVPGEAWGSRLQQELKEAKYVLVVLSPWYVKSPWARMELETAARFESEGRTRIIPVLVADTEIPPFLRSKQYADIRSDYRTGLELIRRAFVAQAESSETPFVQTSRKALDLLRILTSLLGVALGVVANFVSDKAVRIAPSALVIIGVTAVGLTGLIGVLISAYKVDRRHGPIRLVTAAVEAAYIDALDHSALSPFRVGEGK